jgi:hypothetical protein
MMSRFLFTDGLAAIASGIAVVAALMLFTGPGTTEPEPSDRLASVAISWPDAS